MLLVSWSARPPRIQLLPGAVDRAILWGAPKMLGTKGWNSSCLWPVYPVQQLPHNFPLESDMTWLLLTLVSAHQTAAVGRGRAGDAGANRIESQYHG